MSSEVYLTTHFAVNFVNTLDPNNPPNDISLLTQSGITWPQYNSSPDRPLLAFVDPQPSVTIEPDTYRAEAIDVCNDILEAVVNRDEANHSVRTLRTSTPNEQLIRPYVVMSFK